mgnify:CR=1 FL=1
MKKVTILVILFAFALVSCKKDKEAVTPVKNTEIIINPMKELASGSGFSVSNSDGAEGQYQVGIRFLAYKEGSIKRLGLRSPSAGTYRVQLYTFVANDSISLNYPFFSGPERLGYADITIDAAAAASGTTVWAQISSVQIKPWNTDGAGKVRHYGVCFNDLDKTQYQYAFPANTTMPLGFGNGALKIFRYTFTKTNDINEPAWQSTGGGYGNLIYSDVQFEFVTTK